MIALNHVSMLYGARLLFDDVTLTLTPNHRYGLVGANGSGKSTFLKLLTEEETPSLGEILIAKKTRIGWLKQDHFHYETNTLLETVLQGKPELWQALQNKASLLQKDHWDEKTGYQLAHLEEIIAHHNGYTAETFAGELLSGLGLPYAQHHQPLSTLSGGYKLRVLLAQALFQEPEILLLDEPTNHLDIITISWLENYLKTKFSGLLVFISHDQNFLDNLSTCILDIDYGEVREYVGNYSHFLIEKEQILNQKITETKNIEKKIAHLQSFVDRFKAKASKARQAQAREKMIERIELPDIKQSSRVHPHFVFKQKSPSGKQVLQIKHIFKNFDTKKVLHDVTFQVQRGEKVALIGPNGVGKSTLLKILLGQLLADTGEYEWGANTRICYFAQDHHELLQNAQDVFTWLHDSVSEAPTQQVFEVLGQLLFTKDNLNKNILKLSGGEASRLLLAKMMLEQGNILILDEPTNHLDLESREALAKALKQYPGTILFVSHDRHFVSELATRLIALTHQGIKDYQGNYAEYLNYYGLDYLRG